jgi:hypothetical protein
LEPATAIGSAIARLEADRLGVEFGSAAGRDESLLPGSEPLGAAFRRPDPKQPKRDMPIEWPL